MTIVQNVGIDDYKYGFHDSEENYVYKAKKGLNEEIVKEISLKMKKEPQWMTDFRLKSLDIFNKKPMPDWGNTEMLGEIDFDNIHYYVKSTEKQGRNWEDVPEEIKNEIQEKMKQAHEHHEHMDLEDDRHKFMKEFHCMENADFTLTIYISAGREIEKVCAKVNGEQMDGDNESHAMLLTAELSLE